MTTSALILLLCVASGHALASDAGRDWGVERECYPDPVTKVSICEVAARGRSQNLYFHAPNFTADDRYLIFVSDRTGKYQIYRMDVGSGRIVQLTDVPALEASGQAPAVCLDRGDARRVFYVTGAEIFSVDVETSASLRIGVIPPPIGGRILQPSLSHDRRYLALGFQRDRTTWEIGRMDIASGEYRTVLRQGFNMSHIQHSPTDPLIFYVWETGGYAPQRTWLVNPDGTGNRPLYAKLGKTWSEERKELITHESWVAKTGDMTMISIKTGVLLVKKTGESRLVAEGNFLHGAAAPDGKRIALDDTEGNLWLMDTATGKKRLLATGLKPSRFPGFHPHPNFSWDGRLLSFDTASHRATLAIVDLANLPPE